MTFEEAFEESLAEIDRLTVNLRAFFADPEFTDRKNSKWVAASNDLMYAIDAHFRLKESWAEIRSLRDGRRSNPA